MAVGCGGRGAVAGGLGFDHGVVSGGEVCEDVAAGDRGWIDTGPVADRLTVVAAGGGDDGYSVGPQQGDGSDESSGFGGVDGAVAVGVVEHGSGDGGAAFAVVVVGAVLSGGDGDVGGGVVGGGAAEVAEGVGAVVVGGGLCFGEGVGPGGEVGEGVAAVRRCGGGDGGDVGFGEGDGDVLDAGFAGAGDAVVVEVVVDAS